MRVIAQRTKKILLTVPQSVVELVANQIQGTNQDENLNGKRSDNFRQV